MSCSWQLDQKLFSTKWTTILKRTKPYEKLKLNYYLNIYTKAKTSCESAWGPATWHSNIAFSFFFYLFSLSIFYCYPIDHSNLFVLLYKLSIFYPFLLSIVYYYPIDHNNFFFTIISNVSCSWQLDQKLFTTKWTTF